MAGPGFTSDALVKIERRICHLDFLKDRVEELLRDSRRNERPEEAARLGEQLICIYGQLEQLELERTWFMATYSPAASEHVSASFSSAGLQ